MAGRDVSVLVTDQTRADANTEVLRGGDWVDSSEEDKQNENNDSTAKTFTARTMEVDDPDRAALGVQTEGRGKKEMQTVMLTTSQNTEDRMPSSRYPTRTRKQTERLVDFQEQD